MWDLSGCSQPPWGELLASPLRYAWSWRVLQEQWSTDALGMKAPVEAELNEEEQWRNGKRLDQVYVGPANPVVPEMYDLGSRAEQEPGKQHVVPLDPQVTGKPLSLHSGGPSNPISRMACLPSMSYSSQAGGAFDQAPRLHACSWWATNCQACSGGMVGELLAPAGEVCPMVVIAPFKCGEDITTNGVCCAAFRNLSHQRHTSRPLPDQSLEVSHGLSHCKARLSHRARSTAVLLDLPVTLLSAGHSVWRPAIKSACCNIYKQVIGSDLGKSRVSGCWM